MWSRVQPLRWQLLLMVLDLLNLLMMLLLLLRTLEQPPMVMVLLFHLYPYPFHSRAGATILDVLTPFRRRPVPLLAHLALHQLEVGRTLVQEARVVQRTLTTLEQRLQPVLDHVVLLFVDR